MNEARFAAPRAVDPHALANLAGEHIADIVERLNDQSPDEAARLVARLPLERAIEVLDRLRADKTTLPQVDGLRAQATDRHNAIDSACPVGTNSLR